MEISKKKKHSLFHYVKNCFGKNYFPSKILARRGKLNFLLNRIPFPGDSKAFFTSILLQIVLENIFSN